MNMKEIRNIAKAQGVKPLKQTKANLPEDAFALVNKMSFGRLTSNGLPNLQVQPQGKANIFP